MFVYLDFYKSRESRYTTMTREMLTISPPEVRYAI